MFFAIWEGNGTVDVVDHRDLGAMGVSMIGLPIKTDTTRERMSDKGGDNPLAIIPLVVARVDQLRDWFKDENIVLIIICSISCIAHQVRLKM